MYSLTNNWRYACAFYCKTVVVANTNRNNSLQYASNKLEQYHYYDHSFPLRYKALTRDETEGVVRSNEIFVRIVVRKQANYRARGGEWAQPFSLTELLCVPDILSSTNK